MSPTLAIDFGTTRTKVAYLEEATGRPVLVELGREVRAIIPSVFYLPPAGSGPILVGDDAQDMVEVDPVGVVRGLKKEIHKAGQKRVGSNRTAIDRVQLAAELFSYIRKTCEQQIFHGGNLVRCQLTVPVDFKQPQIDAIVRAAQLGGFQEIKTVEEPIAAAQAWLRDHTSKQFGTGVVVCDVGGGTTDFAFLNYDRGNFQMPSDVLSSGFPMGGNDLDEMIWDQMQNSQPDNDVDSLRAALLIKIRRERELMSKTVKQNIAVSVDGHQFILARATVEDRTTEFVQRIKQEAARFLETVAKKTDGGRPPILLVGGASKLPGLKQALEALKTGDVQLWNQSDYATVFGAVDPAPQNSPSAKKASWTKYGEAVEMAWADEVLDRTEFDKLVGLHQKLGISDPEAAQIETAIMGKTKEALVAVSQFSKTSPGATTDILGNYFGIYENQSMDPPVSDRLILKLKNVIGNTVEGELLLYGPLNGKFEFSGKLSGGSLSFITRSSHKGLNFTLSGIAAAAFGSTEFLVPTHRLSITWKGTLDNQHFRGDFVSYSSVSGVSGQVCQKGKWDCQKKAANP